VRKTLTLVLSVALVVVAIGAGLVALQVPVPKEIPGVNFKDPWQKGCVDCHTSTDPKSKLARITVQLDNWNKNPAPDYVIAAAKGAVVAQGGNPAKVTGKHPTPGAMYRGKDIPGDPAKKTECFMCHNPGNKDIPQLDTMLYLLKYGDFRGGKFVTPPTKNEFVTKYGGWCTACHAFEVKDGALTSKILLKQGKEP
jgi:cytochrome c553